MPEERVLIAGGSGFIGRNLTRMLQDQGYSISWLSRSSGRVGEVSLFRWDPSRGEMDMRALDGVDHLVALAGAGIADKRWTKARKDLIISSRVDSAHTLQHALANSNHSVKTITCASAVGYYGNRGEEWLHEEAEPSEGFLSYSTQRWEMGSQGFVHNGIEPAIIRIGLVLGRESGLLKEMDKQLRMGIRAIVGSGRQYYPWIHIDDICGIFIHAIENRLTGIYNGVAPRPETQNDLLKEMVKARGTFALPTPAPAFVLRLMLGEMAAAVLSGQRVKADKIIESGYRFQYEQAEAALQDLYKK